MYKVFVNDRPIILTSSQIREENFSGFIFNRVALKEILHKLKVGKLQGIYLYTDNLEEDWLTFCNTFKTVTAAGGLVVNEKKSFLFIYRGNKWDLPKGKREKGETLEETAIREVKEECGVSELKISSFLLKTYHLFYEKKETKLKETYWYAMKSPSLNPLKPQQAEGITKAVFKTPTETKSILPYTYTNIKLVYKAYQAL